MIWHYAECSVLFIIMLSVAECRYAECRGAITTIAQ